MLDEAHIPEDLNLQSVRLVRISSMVMKKLSGLQSIDSIEMIALMKIPSTFHSVDDEFLEEDCSNWFENAHRVLVLDGIQVNYLDHILVSLESIKKSMLTRTVNLKNVRTPYP